MDQYFVKIEYRTSDSGGIRSTSASVLADGPADAVGLFCGRLFIGQKKGTVEVLRTHTTLINHQPGVENIIPLD